MALFPEAILNEGDCRNLSSFRQGIFKNLLRANAKLYGMAILGSADRWPLDGMPGVPGNIVIRVFEITDKGCADLLPSSAQEGSSSQSATAASTERIFQRAIEEAFAAHPEFIAAENAKLKRRQAQVAEQEEKLTKKKQILQVDLGKLHSFIMLQVRVRTRDPRN